LSKGVHLVLEQHEHWSAALTIPHDKVRVSFAVPWEGMLLLGTTDTLYEGDPADVAVDDADVDQVLAEAAGAIDGLDRGRIRASFAGLRVLPGGEGSTTEAPRETVYMRSAGGMVSVAGGKLTTYRRIALDALRHLGVRGIDRRPWPLAGATGLDRVTFPDAVAPELRSHLLHLYGSLADEVLAPSLEDPRLLEPIAPGGPDIEAQALYARTHEWARTDEDVLRRRTTVALRGLSPPAEASADLRRPTPDAHAARLPRPSRPESAGRADR
jgi:glycerol-3-phosphate dehydrogenase